MASAEVQIPSFGEVLQLAHGASEAFEGFKKANNYHKHAPGEVTYRVMPAEREPVDLQALRWEKDTRYEPEYVIGRRKVTRERPFIASYYLASAHSHRVGSTALIDFTFFGTKSILNEYEDVDEDWSHFKQWQLIVPSTALSGIEVVEIRDKQEVSRSVGGHALSLSGPAQA